MRFSNTILVFLFIIAPVVTLAQLEAAVWPVGSGKQFDFQSGSFEFLDFSGNPDAKATICDKDGNLVLYTDGRTLWNRNNEIVVNGEKLIFDDAFQNIRPIFVPYPKKDGWYILFYEEDYYTITGGKYDNALYCAEINTNSNNGKGEVVRQKIKVHDNYHSEPTIAGFCNNSYYWLVIDRNENTIIEEEIDRIYFYKIDNNGVNLSPKINDKLDIGNSSGYKFSPNGDKIYFRYGGNSIDQELIADFNFTTGDLYNLRSIENEVYFRKEFSPDSKHFYFFKGANLIQLKVDFTSSVLIENSAETILTLNTNSDVQYPGMDLQLAPDGKIYFSYFDINDGRTKIGRINKPNYKGVECGVELDVVSLSADNFIFPQFATSFFRDKHPEIIDRVFPKAGTDLNLCSRSITTIGMEQDAKAFYQWSPMNDLADPFSPQTLISPPAYYGSPLTTTYILRATDGNCWVNFDSTDVTIRPIPKKLPIDGSWSVCPFVEEVDYWTVDDKNKLQWLVDGGEIVSNPLNDSVKISWGETNSKASVSVFSANSYGCSSDTSVFPVRINVELITETPKGPDRICITERTNVNYQIRNTNGSVYNWFPEAGKVVMGQGTNKVIVNWFGEGLHKLTVEETSVTIDTICFGESEPLMVNVVNDSLEIELTNIYFNPDNLLVIRYLSEKFKKTHKLFLIIQNKNGQVIDEIQVASFNNGEINYMPVGYEYNSEIISLKVENNCNEIFYSNLQQTITLRGKEKTSENSIRLNWNINQFWENDRLEHEIWHSANGKDGWKLVVAGVAGTEFDYQLHELSLTHYFRIKEINSDKNTESWSNTIKIEIEDDLIIPDVFTPNGDGINDEWQIKNVYFHPFHQVIVYNRYGQKIYECNNDFIPWDGKINGEIFQGTYFYQIIFDARNIRYGQVTIVQ